MPDTEEVKKTVDLDTSGPAMDVDIAEKADEAEIVEKETVTEEPAVRPVVEDQRVPEDKTHENEREVKLDQQYLDEFREIEKKEDFKHTSGNMGKIGTESLEEKRDRKKEELKLPNFWRRASRVKKAKDQFQD